MRKNKKKLSKIFKKNKIDFCFQYKNKGKYEIKIIYKQHLKNMNSMFLECPSLTYLNLSNFNTINVNSMNCIFNQCHSLISLNLSYFNTKNVINMENIFNNCSSLVSLNLSNFNTINVNNMRYNFSECFSLIFLNFLILILIMI